MARLGRSFPARPIVKAPYPWAPNIQISKTYNSGDIPAASSLSDTAYWYGNNRMFSFDVSMFGPGVTVTSMTFGGANCTFIGARSTVTSFGRVESWRILQSDPGAPTDGGTEIAVTLSGSVEFTVVGVARTGVHQTNPVINFDSNQATEGVSPNRATVTITPPTTYSTLVHAAIACNDTNITCMDTERNNVPGTLGSGGNSDQGFLTYAASTDLRWDIDALTTWAMTGYVIRPISAPASSQSFTAVKGDLTLSSVAGKMTASLPGVKGALALSSVAGTMTNSFGGAKGDLTLTGQTAIFSQGQQFVFVKGDLTLSSVAGKMTDSFAGVKGDLVLSSVAGGMANAITGVKGDLTLSSSAGKMTSAFGGVKGDLLLTGYAGSEWNVYVAVKGDLVLNGYASSISNGTVFTAVKGDLTLTGYGTPIGAALRIVKGDLILTGYAGSFTSAAGITIVKGDLALTGYALVTTQMPTIIVAGNLVLTGYALRVRRTMQGWHLYGRAPTIVRLSGDSR